jgi:hypothetical protein
VGAANADEVQATTNADAATVNFKVTGAVDALIVALIAKVVSVVHALPCIVVSF